jgi:hypothetical protein
MAKLMRRLHRYGMGHDMPKTPAPAPPSRHPTVPGLVAKPAPAVPATRPSGELPTLAQAIYPNLTSIFPKPTNASPMTTAAEVVAFIANLNVAQLDALAHAIGQRKSQLEDATLLRDIVRDQRVNPVMNALPAAPTEWSAHRLATFDLEQEQKAEARRNGGAASVSHGRWG